VLQGGHDDVRLDAPSSRDHSVSVCLPSSHHRAADSFRGAVCHDVRLGADDVLADVLGLHLPEVLRAWPKLAGASAALHGSAHRLRSR
jgi:hypothetical protein